jgi:membrane-bound lytic murein transglycosylase D
MAIRALFAVSALSLSSVLTAGSVLPATADPLLASSELEHAAIPPQGDDLSRSDLSMERGMDEVGSGAEPTPWSDGALAVANVVDDPWADAYAESARLASLVPRLVAPYQLSMNSEVKFFLDRFTGNHRKIVGTWIDRSTRYLAMIRDVLRARGMPEELAFTAMIESGYNPLAVSRVGAKGLWQFMAATARSYGLRVDQWVDERLDPEKSTVAAASYLQDLHTQFGSWILAQAAYNAGEVAVARAIRATRSTDFWVLARTNFLRRETKEFVPQIHAATMIGREPSRYGFDPAIADLATFDRVAVPPATDLGRLSTAAGVPADELRAMNPVLVKGVTPPGRPYDLKVPVGTTSTIVAALAARTIVVAAPATHAVGRKADVHVVRPRDTVTSIARRYGISVGDVLKWNSLETRDRIRPGDRLRVAELRGDGRAVR